MKQRAEAVGLPLWSVELSWPCTNAEYESQLNAVLARAQEEHFAPLHFGGLFLNDIRAYREKPLEHTGIEPLFPV